MNGIDRLNNETNTLRKGESLAPANIGGVSWGMTMPGPKPVFSAAEDGGAAAAGGAEVGAAAPGAETDVNASGGASAAGAGASAAGAGADAGTMEAGADEGAGSSPGELQQLREMLAGGDEKYLSELARYKSKEALLASVREARKIARNAGKVPTLSDKATEKEVKAFREAMGIPDEPDAYPVAFREDYQASDFDTQALSSFKEHMHGKNADPRAASAAIEWFQDFAVAQQQELNATLAKTAKETQSTLRTEWGGEYEGNLNAAKQLLTTQLGEDGLTQMMSLRLMDGSRLQDNLPFVKMMAQLGGDYYGGTAIIGDNVEMTSNTVQERISELMALRTSDERKYKSDDVQSELTKLYAQRKKLQARGA